MKFAIFLALLALVLLSGCENGSKAKTNKRTKKRDIAASTEKDPAPIDIKELPTKNPPRRKLNGGRPQVGLPVVPLFVGGRSIQVEVAAEQLQRNIGLMHRQSLGRDKGMIFVYPVKSIRSFWMKDTLIPLTIAYIRDNGTIADLVDMEPGGDAAQPPSYPSSEEVRFALEMNQGWFKKNKIKVGMKVVGIEQADKD
ncbi:MAG: DUF192 domain-containing protein [Planctomycetota bacterium]|nr:DUF192 domain-containing protein [Planctomycetota bacterium]